MEEEEKNLWAENARFTFLLWTIFQISSELVTSIDAKMDEIIKLNWYSNFLTGMVFNCCRWLIKQFEW